MFRLSDSADEGAVSYAPGPPFPEGARWRVLPAPGDRLPGTFDQDVYVELLRRYYESGLPGDGTVTFTLHAFLRAMGRRVDGRTYEQLRGALTRLERTVLESFGAYYVAPQLPSKRAAEQAGNHTPLGEDPNEPGTRGRFVDERLTVLTAVSIERRRSSDRDQLALFPSLASDEPGEARVTLAPSIRGNVTAGYATTLSAGQYFALPSPTARRLYRLLAAVEFAPPGAAESLGSVAGTRAWDVALEALAEQLPLSQRYPSHLMRVLEPAHDMLRGAGIIRDAAIRQQRREWVVHYELS